MGISYESLLGKMEQELAKAKHAAGSQQLYSHVYALKALAEIVLESRGSDNEIAASAVVQPPPKPVDLAGSEPLQTEDGANGNSIFDF